jgi:hypothetical protein
MYLINGFYNLHSSAEIHPFEMPEIPVEIDHKTCEIDQVLTCVNSSRTFDYMMILNR